MRRPRLLDLFCCQGGASAGYRAAGFDVVGVDWEPQPRYPFPFFRADALTFSLDGFDAVHASPPCQAHTRAQKIRKNDHPDLIEPIRAKLILWGGPYVIENVEGAPLKDPVMLCGAMFGLRTYRHRLFETNWPLDDVLHPAHDRRTAKMGRPIGDANYHAVGNFSGVDLVRRDMGVGWMDRDGIRECIPPSYTLFIGGQLRRVVR